MALLLILFVFLGFSFGATGSSSTGTVMPHRIAPARPSAGPCIGTNAGEPRRGRKRVPPKGCSVTR
jgi:hypothetical protein